MDRFASPTAPLTLLLPDTIPVCEIGEPIAQSQPGSLARGRARFCKHPIVSLCRLQTRMPGGRIHPRKTRAEDNRAVRPISNFVRTNSAAAWAAAAAELVP